MMHYTPSQGLALEKATPDRPDVGLAEIEASKAAVRRAIRAAEASLRRVNAAAGPHDDSNAGFVLLLDRHRLDREALFAAMRRLDAARDAVRRPAADAAAPGGIAIPAGD